MLRSLVFAARARIALPQLAGVLALMLVAGGCARPRTARVPPPPARIGSIESGVASWYGIPYHGRPSASGEIFDMEKLTAAHRTLPFQTWVEVTNLSNGKQVNVRITDRGPFVGGRIIDLSRGAAVQLDMLRAGTARVRLKVITPPANALENVAEPAARYAVQAGAFADRARAEALRATLPYPDARVVEPLENSPLWRVLVGHTLTIQGANALADEVRKLGGQAIVIQDRE